MQYGLRDAAIIESLSPNQVYALFTTNYQDLIFSQEYTFYRYNGHAIEPIHVSISNIAPLIPVPHSSPSMFDTELMAASLGFLEKSKSSFERNFSQLETLITEFVEQDNQATELRDDTWQMKRKTYMSRRMSTMSL
jgi:hypothetical protein